jgi:hypothetical protein
MPNTGFRAVLTAATLALAAMTGAVSAQDVPNLVGTWSGTIAGGARFGSLTHDPAHKDPVFADRSKEWFLTVEKQDGSGLIGTWGREARSEKLVGAIRRDNVTVIFADEDNIFDGRLLSANEMELCGLEAGEATIAVCFLMKRK